MLKPIIGAAMIMLWDKSKSLLEDLVSKFILEFAELKVKIERDDGETELVL